MRGVGGAAAGLVNAPDASPADTAAGGIAWKSRKSDESPADAFPRVSVNLCDAEVRSSTRSASRIWSQGTSGCEENAATSLFQPGVDSSASRRRTENSEPLPRLPRLPALPELPAACEVGGDGRDASDRSDAHQSLGPFACITASAPSAACVYALSAVPGFATSASASETPAGPSRVDASIALVF